MKQHPTELLSTVELWIAFLEKQEQFELLKIAKVTHMKLKSLSDVYEQVGGLTENQNVVLNLCIKDYEYIQQELLRLRYEPKNLLH